MKDEMSARTNFRPWQLRKLDDSLLRRLDTTFRNTDTSLRESLCESKQTFIGSQSCQTPSSSEKMKVCTPDLPYVCIICGNSYSTNSNLKRHQRVKHEAKEEHQESTLQSCMSLHNPTVDDTEEDMVHGDEGKNISVELPERPSISSLDSKDGVNKKCVIKLTNLNVSEVDPLLVDNAKASCLSTAEKPIKLVGGKIAKKKLKENRSKALKRIAHGTKKKSIVKLFQLVGKKTPSFRSKKALGIKGSEQQPADSMGIGVENTARKGKTLKQSVAGIKTLKKKSPNHTGKVKNSNTGTESVMLTVPVGKGDKPEKPGKTETLKESVCVKSKSKSPKSTHVKSELKSPKSTSHCVKSKLKSPKSTPCVKNKLKSTPQHNKKDKNLSDTLQSADKKEQSDSHVLASQDEGIFEGDKIQSEKEHLVLKSGAVNKKERSTHKCKVLSKKKRVHEYVQSSKKKDQLKSKKVVSNKKKKDNGNVQSTNKNKQWKPKKKVANKNEYISDNKASRSSSTVQSPGNKASRSSSTVQSPGNKASRSSSTVQSPGNKASRSSSTVHSPGNKASRSSSTVHSPGNKASRSNSTVQSPGNMASRSSSTVQSPGNKASRSSSTVQSPGNKASRSSSTVQSPGNKASRSSSTVQSPGNKASRSSSNSKKPQRKKKSTHGKRNIQSVNNIKENNVEVISLEEFRRTRLSSSKNKQQSSASQVSQIETSGMITDGDNMVKVVDLRSKSPKNLWRNSCMERQPTVENNVVTVETGDSETKRKVQRSRSRSPKKTPKSVVIDKACDAEINLLSEAKRNSPTMTYNPFIIPDIVPETADKPPFDIPPPLYSVGLKRTVYHSDDVIDRALFNLFTPPSIDWALPAWKSKKPDKEVDFKAVKLKITKDLQSQKRVVTSVIPCSNIMDIPLKITRDFSKSQRTVVQKRPYLFYCDDEFDQSRSCMTTNLIDKVEASPDKETTRTQWLSDNDSGSNDPKNIENLSDISGGHAYQAQTVDNKETQTVIDDNENHDDPVEVVCDTSAENELMMNQEEDVRQTPPCLMPSDVSVDESEESALRDVLSFSEYSKNDVDFLSDSEAAEVKKLEKYRGKPVVVLNQFLQPSPTKVSDDNKGEKTKTLLTRNKGEVNGNAHVVQEKTLRNEETSKIPEIPVYVTDKKTQGNLEVAQNDRFLHNASLSFEKNETLGNLQRSPKCDQQGNRNSVMDSHIDALDSSINSNSTLDTDPFSALTVESEAEKFTDDQLDNDTSDCDQVGFNKERSETSSSVSIFNVELNENTDSLNSDSLGETTKSSSVIQLVESEINGVESERSSLSFEENDVEQSQGSKTSPEITKLNSDNNVTLMQDELEPTKVSLVICEKKNVLSDSNSQSETVEPNMQEQKMCEKEKNETEKEISATESESDCDNAKVSDECTSPNTSETAFRMTGKLDLRKYLGSVKNKHESIGNKVDVIDTAIVKNASSIVEHAQLPKNSRKRRPVNGQRKVENGFDELDGSDPCSEFEFFTSELLTNGNSDSFLGNLQSDITGLTGLLDMDCLEHFSDEELRSILNGRTVTEPTECGTGPQFLKSELVQLEDKSMSSVVVKPVNGCQKNHSYLNEMKFDIFQLVSAVESEHVNDNVMNVSGRSQNGEESTRKDIEKDLSPTVLVAVKDESCSFDSHDCEANSQNLAESQTEGKKSSKHNDISCSTTVQNMNENITGVKSTFILFFCKMCGREYRSRKGICWHCKTKHPEKKLKDIIQKAVNKPQKMVIKLESPEKATNCKNHNGLRNNRQSVGVLNVDSVPQGIGSADSSPSVTGSSPCKSRQVSSAKFVCTICHNQYKQNRNLQHHIKTCHQGTENTATAENPVLTGDRTNLREEELGTSSGFVPIANKDQVDDQVALLNESNSQGDNNSSRLCEGNYFSGEITMNNSEYSSSKVFQKDADIPADVYRNSGLNIMDKAIVKLKKFPLLEGKISIGDMVLTPQGSGSWNVKSSSNRDPRITEQELLADVNNEKKIASGKDNDSFSDGTVVKETTLEINPSINITINHTADMDIRTPQVDDDIEPIVKDCLNSTNTEVAMTNHKTKSKRKIISDSEHKSKKKKMNDPGMSTEMTDFEMAISAPRSGTRKTKKRKLERQNSTEVQNTSTEQVTKPAKAHKDQKTLNEPSSKIVKNILRRQKEHEKEKDEIPVVEKPAPFEEILAQNVQKKKNVESLASKNATLQSQKVTDVYQNVLVTQPAKFSRSFRKSQQESSKADEKDLWRSPLANIGHDISLKFGSTQSKPPVLESEISLSGKKSGNSVSNSKNYLLEIMKDIPSIHDTSTTTFVSPFDNPLVSPKSGMTNSGFSVPTTPLLKTPLKWNFEEMFSQSTPKELSKLLNKKDQDKLLDASEDTMETVPSAVDVIPDGESESRWKNGEANLPHTNIEGSSCTKSKGILKRKVTKKHREKLLKDLEDEDYLDYDESMTDGESLSNDESVEGDLDVNKPANEQMCNETSDLKKVTWHIESNASTAENFNKIVEPDLTLERKDKSGLNFDVSASSFLPDGIHCLMEDEDSKIENTDSLNSGEYETEQLSNKVIEDNYDNEADSEEEESTSQDTGDESTDGEQNIEEGLEEINIHDFNEDNGSIDHATSDKEEHNDKIDDNASESSSVYVVKTSKVSKKTVQETANEAVEDTLSLFVNSDEELSLFGDTEEQDVLSDREGKPSIDDRGQGGNSNIQDNDVKEVNDRPSMSSNIQIVVSQVPGVTAESQCCVQQKQGSVSVPKALLPIYGFCSEFLKSGVCTKNNCRYSHADPPPNLKLKSGVLLISEACKSGNKAKAFEIYNILKQNNYGRIPAMTLDNLFSLSVDVGEADAAFQLLGDLSNQKILNDQMTSVILRLCGHRPHIYVEQLWALFECIQAQNIRPDQDAMGILFRAFLGAREWQKLWMILLYCKNLVGLVIPLFVVESAISVCIKNPAMHLNSANRWISTSDRSMLFQLNHKIIEEFLDVCSKNGCQDIAAMLKRIVSDPLHERMDSDEDLNDYKWDVEAKTPTEEIMENYKCHLHRLRSCILTQYWDFLASTFIDLCRNPELCNLHFLRTYQEILFDTRTPETRNVAFRQFVENVYKNYEEEVQGDVLVQLDRPALARIGALLLLKYYENCLWDQGYSHIITMHQLGVMYYRCRCTENEDTVLLAVEVCLKTGYAESALQILDRSQWLHFPQDKMGQALCLLQNVIEILLEKGNTHKALQVLGIMVQKSCQCNTEEQNAVDMCGLFKHLINVSCDIGDPTSALAAYQLHKHVNTLGSLDVLQLRLLLRCCAEQGWLNYAQEFCETCIKLGAYPAQNIEHEPRYICLSSGMTSVENFLLISYYLDGLYNVLCNKVLDGYGVTEDDYRLAIGIVWSSDDSSPQFRPANSVYIVYKMIIDILKRDITPPLEAQYNDNTKFIYISPVSLKKHMDEKDANGRRQGLHITVGPGVPRGRRNNRRGRIWGRQRSYR